MQNALRYLSLTVALTLCSPALAAPIDAESGGAKVGHGSGGIMLLRAE